MAEVQRKQGQDIGSNLRTPEQYVVDQGRGLSAEEVRQQRINKRTYQHRTPEYYAIKDVPRQDSYQGSSWRETYAQRRAREKAGDFTTGLDDKPGDYVRRQRKHAPII